MLPCEPPHLGPEATLGGMVAAGLSGPRRPWAGSVRDFVLGTRVITGHGKLLRFGGEVMKNVAGYDVSRLMAGSFGCLGLLTEVSLKVLPRPRLCLSLRLAMGRNEALAELAEWGQQSLPISAACHEGETLYLRLEGGEGSVQSARQRLGATRSITASGATCANSAWRSLPTPPPVAPFRTHRYRRAGPARPATARLGGPALAQDLRVGAGHSRPGRQGGRPRHLLRPRCSQQPAAAGCTDALPPRPQAAARSPGVFNPGRLYPDL